MGCLITTEYLSLNRQLHENEHYGTGGYRRVPDVMALALKVDAKTILDYGCGKSTLKKSLTMPVREYDPAIPGKDSPPMPADMVVCTDVLEHVEPECLEEVIRDIRRLSLKATYVVVHTTPAQKTLADGRNAHLIQEKEDWWAERLGRYFDISIKKSNDRESAFVLIPKGDLCP